MDTRKKNKIRGELFERWLLKTFINIELLANFNTHIPPELVEIAFGRRPFFPKSGLFYVVNEKNAVVPERAQRSGNPGSARRARRPSECIEMCCKRNSWQSTRC